MPRLIYLLILLRLPAVAGGARAAGAPVTTVEAARALSFAEAAAGVPADLSGVVSYLREAPGNLFNFNLHDATGGLMIYPARHVQIQPGQQVRIRGLTTHSVHGLRIEKAEVEPGPMGPLPVPLPVSLTDLESGSPEGFYVELEAAVRAVRLESPDMSPRRLALDFGPRSRRVTALITHFPDAAAAFQPGQRLRVRGVALRWTNARGQTQDVTLMVNDAADTSTVTAAPPALPRPLTEVQTWNGPDEPAAPMATTGILTLIEPGSLMVLQSGPQAIRLRPAAPRPGPVAPAAPLQPGDELTVSGFPVLGEYTVELEDALVSTVRPGILPEPESHDLAGSVLANAGLVDRDARRISLTGKVTARRSTTERAALELTSGITAFTAWLPPGVEAPEAAEPGAVLRLTGILNLHLTPERRRIGRSPDQFSLTLAGPGDILLISPAPWWTAARLWRALGLIAAAGLLCAAWAAFAARRHALLRAEISRRELAEQQLAGERRRMAADLHDTLEQTLLAARLQLNAASRTLTSSPEAAARRLTLTHQLLARSRQEVRDAVWDLHAGEDAPPDLATVLSAVCQEAAASSAVKVKFEPAPDLPAVPAALSGQAVRLVREALTNALKHAAPQQVLVSATAPDGHLRLSIADDGSGFDPAAAPGMETGHFGLTSIQERVRRLGGTLDLQSRPGSGTNLTVLLPLF